MSADLSKVETLGLAVNRFSKLSDLLVVARSRVKRVDPRDLAELFFADCKGRLEPNDVVGDVLTVDALTLVAAESDAWIHHDEANASTACFNRPAEDSNKFEQAEDARVTDGHVSKSTERSQSHHRELKISPSQKGNSTQSRSRSTERYRSHRSRRRESKSRQIQKSKRKSCSAWSSSTSTERYERRSRRSKISVGPSQEGKRKTPSAQPKRQKKSPSQIEPNRAKGSKDAQSIPEKHKRDGSITGCIWKLYARGNQQLEFLELHMRDKTVKKFPADADAVPDGKSCKAYLDEDELITSLTQVERGEHLGACLTFKTSLGKTITLEGWINTGKKWWTHEYTVDSGWQICNLGFEGSRLVFVETLPANGKGDPCKRMLDGGAEIPPPKSLYDR